MNKEKVFHLLDLSLWIINPILLVAIIFGQQIETGLFLQWLGKMHPLALHFPIVFGITIAIYLIFFSKHRFELQIEKLIVATNALFASVVALLGVFLSSQGGYEGDIFSLHKWGGFAIAIFSWLLLQMLNRNEHLLRLVAVVFLGVLIGATHKGAQLTHGENALSFPERVVTDAGEVDLFDGSATVFEAGIAPILNQKCISCHGAEREKGKLRLDSKEFILKGGRSGDILNPGLSGDPLLIKLTHLPIEDEDRMPPNGKLQLTELEMSILRNWVNSGSNFDLSINALPGEDSLVNLLKEYLNANSQTEIILDRPDLDEYNTDYCAVNYLYYGTDAVEVNFFQASFYDRETLKRLLNIKDKIVRLNMQNMPLDSKDLDIILQFTNLEKVNLNSTGLEMSDLTSLKDVRSIQNLAICGLDFNDQELDELLSGSGFKAVNIWSDNLDKTKLDKIVAKYPGIDFTIGDNLESKVLKINTPVIAQDSLIIKTSLEVPIKHLLTGVDIFFTTDGSQPDSLSTKYTEPIKVSQNTVIKAKAYKKGWISSEVVQRTFYKSGITPDTIYLTQAPNPKYKGKGASTLTDHSLGETNISNGEWLGYQDDNLEFVIGFDQAQVLNSVEINCLTALAPHVFPPKSIAVSGSHNGIDFEHISEMEFPMAKEGTPLQAELFACSLPANSEFAYYRIRVSNVKEMPQWHQASGKPAWVFVDEIFLN